MDFFRNRRLATTLPGAAAVLALWLIGTALAPAQASDAELQKFRAERARQISSPDGWLTLIGLEWLKPGPNGVGSAEDNQIHLKARSADHLAVISVDGTQLRLSAPQGGFPAGLLLNGQPATESALHADDDKPSILSTDHLTMIILHRGDRYALRVKDSESQARKSFHGLNWYPAEAKYKVSAKWIPFVPVHTAKIPTIIGTTLDLPAPGLAEFQLDGKTIQLEPVLEDKSSKELFFILRDATSRTTTYEAARFLYAQFPDHGLDQPGTLLLDFNRLQNPPCAYTAYATCPLPPFENRLSVAIPAGEKRYRN